MYELLVQSFEFLGVPLENLVGFGGDNASVNKGDHNSIFSRLRERCLGIVLMKCICHSLLLAAKSACKKFPHGCENLARNLHSQFNHSDKRVAQFEEFQAFLNTANSRYHTMLRLALTRWLWLSANVDRILEQWEPLSCEPGSLQLADSLADLIRLVPRAAPTDRDVLRKNDDDWRDLPMDSTLTPDLLQETEVDVFWAKVFDEVVLLCSSNPIVTRAARDLFGVVRAMGAAHGAGDTVSHQAHLQRAVSTIRAFVFHGFDAAYKLRQGAESRWQPDIRGHPYATRADQGGHRNKSRNAPTLRAFNNKCFVISLMGEPEIGGLEGKKHTGKFWTEMKSYVDVAGERLYSVLADFTTLLLVLPWSTAGGDLQYHKDNQGTVTKPDEEHGQDGTSTAREVRPRLRVPESCGP
ncbi:hypothetical protein FOCC_FOCC007474 [Frankliniella occidentalis]|nr:hypothetical protein FOCC_FOCC007474 [Frankliniella occidentalis]